MLGEFAKASFWCGDPQHCHQEALKEAAAEADRSGTLTGRVTGLCEVAEAAAECTEFRLADALFDKAHQLIPAGETPKPANQQTRDGRVDDARPQAQQRGSTQTPVLGMKVKKVRPYLLAEWLAGLAKAASLHPRSGSYQIRWADKVQDRRLLDELSEEPTAHDEACRAFVVAGAWQALFDKEYQNDKTSLWREVQETMELIGNPATRVRALRDRAVLEASADLNDPGRIDYALRRITSLAEGFDKDDVLHRVGTIFASGALDALNREASERHLRAYLRVLPPCAEYFGAAYLMLAKLVRLFPRHASAIHEVLKRRKLWDVAPSAT